VYREGEDFDYDIVDYLEYYFKERLKRDNVKKAKYVIPKKLKELDQEIISDDIVKKHIIEDGLEIIVAYISGKYYIGRTLDVVRNHEFISRDFGRPFQNPKESIPPKIARIMVNLTGVSSGGTLFDPFCGIGTILQEAAMLGLHIFGADIDRQRVAETIRNLQWLNETYNLKMTDVYDRIFTVDSRDLSKDIHVQMDGIATEPILIPPLKKFPSKREAEDMLEIARTTYEETIPEMVKILKSERRLVIVAPYIRTDKHRELRLDLEDVFKKTGLLPYSKLDNQRFNYPLRGFSDKDQKVLRGIYVLEKL
ncbi:TRM11 family SAM-dependent methyltransferase, partial [Thermoproteota archaeon]